MHTAAAKKEALNERLLIGWDALIRSSFNLQMIGYNCKEYFLFGDWWRRLSSKTEPIEYCVSMHVVYYFFRIFVVDFLFSLSFLLIRYLYILYKIPTLKHSFPKQLLFFHCCRSMVFSLFTLKHLGCKLAKLRHSQDIIQSLISLLSPAPKLPPLLALL